ncbi:MAG TPA: methionine--tRNA ligase [Thermoanaerobaculia bacterium]|nr:methionine--tRNA ligase [Thermoanaerobaculia bacterium]
MKSFYATTPIYYVNDLPHIGHIYTTVVGDALTRFHRLVGDPTRFLTGTDEHGQKIQKAAAEQGVSPIALADRVVARYRELWKLYGIANDDFIRTTEERHRRGVEAFIARIDSAGDLYTAKHEGWYCSGCELFYTEKELDAEKRCPIHETPCVRTSEENVFFRLSRYAEPLLSHIESHPEFIRPETRRAEVVSFIRGGLNDLSVSRTKIEWGIPFPGRPGHVVYVWLDALANYITALGFATADDALYRKFWESPDSTRIHLIGKDILRQHAVYWPAFLLSAGVPLPTSVWAHGWWLRDGKKISKSVGAIVRPDDLARDFGPDAVRYFLLREMAFGQDASFSDEAFLARYNADLANDLGNTVSRVAALCRQSFGRAPGVPCAANDVHRVYRRVRDEWKTAMGELAFHRALEAVWKLLSEINGYVVTREPWKIRKQEGASRPLHRILYSAAEGVRLAAVLLSPFMPATSRKIFETLGLPAEDPVTADLRWGGLRLDAPLPEAPALFPRADAAAYLKGEPVDKVEPEKREKAETTIGPDPKATGAVAPPETTQAASPSDGKIGIEEFQKVRLVTAKIVAAERVPKSNKLMRLQVDLGSEQRQVVAGIAAKYSAEELVGRNVVVVANLRPAKLMGVESNGMVLAAAVGETGEPSLLAVADGIPPGTRVK